MKKSLHIFYLIIFLFVFSNLEAEILKKIDIDGNERIARETIIVYGEIKKNQDLIGVVPWSDNGPEPLLMQINSSKFLNLISNKSPMPLRKLVDNNDFQAIDSKIIENEIGHENALRNLNRPEDLIF